ncbi:MAG: glycosyltransferase family 2 protein [Bacteroidia bacterium]|nr:glycosyltransferase family 2 protein [Bacteroidia bacterium]MCC7533474.1 glycosyltransferase family 2 protein [Bacteroidia bacterium]MCZ2139938.1 glycosyltransferase family 2 protein [Bacteroidia bacterium]
MQQPVLDISVLIPLYNEDESLPELLQWIERVMLENKFSYEVLLVDDGSKDNSWKVIEQLQQKNKHIKGIRFRRNYGKSAALNVGFQHTIGRVVITMDADLQDSPDEIPELYAMIVEQGYDIVSGWKKKRYDPLTKTIPTKLFNWATRKMSGINNLHDFNCGLKSYHWEVVKNIEVYNEMHRYIPVIAKWAGYTKITEKVVQHRERKYGTTKFGLERFINGFLDLLTIFFVSKFGKKPMHFFGVLGTLSFFTGFIITCVLIGEKVYNSYKIIEQRSVTDMPLFYLALVLLIVGVQLFLAGFIGEMISRNANERNIYGIKQKVGFDN